MNIALVEEGIPVVGIVHVPAQNKTYYGVKGAGSFKSEDRNQKSEIRNEMHYSAKDKVVVVGSRSHLSPETLQFVEDLKGQGKRSGVSFFGQFVKTLLSG